MPRPALRSFPRRASRESRETLRVGDARLVARAAREIRCGDNDGDRAGARGCERAVRGEARVSEDGRFVGKVPARGEDPRCVGELQLHVRCGAGDDGKPQSVRPRPVGARREPHRRDGTRSVERDARERRGRSDDAVDPGALAAAAEEPFKVRRAF